MNKKYFLISLFLVGLLIPIFRVFAENEAVNLSSRCVFDDKFKELQNVLENKDSDYLTRYNQELRLRKEILSKILDCLISDSENYKITLLNLNITKPAVSDLRKILINDLDKTIDYFNFRKSQVQNLNLDGLKYTARSLKEDRESRFIPLNQKINVFILWNKNEELFNLAQNRINEINKTIKLFKFGESEEIQSLFNNVSDKLKIALERHNNAWNAIDNFDYEKSNALIQESLNNLLDAYSLLYDLSKKIADLMLISK
jgi:hypothetical protein